MLVQLPGTASSRMWLFGLSGSTYDVAKAAFGRAAARINTAASAAPAAATETPLFHGSPVAVEVFRDADTAAAASKHDSRGFAGGPVVGCEDGWIWVYPGDAGLNCRVVNVELGITAASADLAKAALAPMLQRLAAALK